MTPEEQAAIADLVAQKMAPQIQTLTDEVKKGATPAGSSFGKHITATPIEDAAIEKEKGARVAQMVLARAAVALRAREGNPCSAASWAAKVYGEDHPVTKALGTDTLSGGGALIPTPLSSEVIELLRPASVVRQLNPIIMPMVEGKASVPKIVGGATAAYQGENQAATKSQPSFGNLELSAKKISALVPISNDMIRRPSIQAVTVVRDDMVAALGQRSDYAFIRDDGTVYKPKGLRFWAPAANVIPANGTVNLANVTEDLGKLRLALRRADVRMLRPGYIIAPGAENYLRNVRDGNGNYAFREEMNAGRLDNFPYRVTSQIPEDLGSGNDESEVYFVDFADAVIAESLSLLIEASTEASYTDGGNLVSAFERDQTVIKAIQEHDFGMRHDASVAVLTEVTWE